VGESYSCPSGGVIAGGRRRFAHNALLDRIAAAPDNSWLQINDNTYESVWPAKAFRPMWGAAEHEPRKIIASLSSFAWDDSRLCFYLFGGGHASTNGNEVYRFSAVTGQWDLAFHSADVQPLLADDGITSAGEVPKPGALSAPQSCHTYATSIYLPHLDRAAIFGGACSPTGGPWRANGPDRTLGPFLLDTTLAGQGYVGTTTGSNVQRVGTASENVILPGANAWSNRDWKLDHPLKNGTAISNYGKVINGWTAYANEGGKDVVYVTSQSSGTAGLHMFRVTFNDLDYHNDTIEQIGQSWTGYNRSRQGGCYDPMKNLAFFLYDQNLASGNVYVSAWNLDTPGTSNHDFTVGAAGFGGDGVASYIAAANNAVGEAGGATNFGITYDERRNVFPLWQRGGKVWYLETPPQGTLTTGWKISEVVSTDALASRPMLPTEFDVSNKLDIGVCGKWRRSAHLDCYVALQHNYQGNVWLFKPSGWSDPRTR